MIPKKIHYCWFGGKPLTELGEKCLKSWEKFCPDYEIKRWDESNFDVNCCDYVREAYQAKKYAFVSDYARFAILYIEGGLYFDTDVELINPIDDIVEQGSFMGCEPCIVSEAVNAGLGMAAAPGLGIYKIILDGYKKRHFVKQNGELDLTTVVQYVTGILKNKGFDEKLIGIQKVDELYIYPPEYFCPINGLTMEKVITNNTRSIHHFDGSWMNPVHRVLAKWMKRLLSKDLNFKIRNLKSKL